MTLGSKAKSIYSVAATSEGTVLNSSFNTERIQTYAITMKFIKSKAYYNSGIMVRAYAKLSDGRIVYSDVHTKTIYSIADELYQKEMVNTEAQHNYLYEKILKLCNPDYRKVLFQ